MFVVWSNSQVAEKNDDERPFRNPEGQSTLPTDSA